MKLIQFKIILLTIIEILVGLLFTIFHYFIPTSKIQTLTEKSLLIFLISIPVFLILPSYNWLWLVEENFRTNKLSLEEKAEKHLHLSMLYSVLISYFFLTFLISIVLYNSIFFMEITFFLIPTSILLGLICARNCYISITSYPQFYAMGWDKKRPFLTVIFDSIFPRNENWFLRRNFVWGIIFLLLAIICPVLFFFLNPKLLPPFDKSGWLTVFSFYNSLFSICIWNVSFYIFFQLFYSKQLLKWVSMEKKKAKHEKSHYFESKKSSVA